MSAEAKPELMVQSYFHCRECIAEVPDGTSPRDWARLEVGWTKKGVQVWCARHDMNVAHIDFMGQKVGLL